MVDAEQKNKSILIIDDDEDYLFQQKAYLEAAGYEVIATESSEKAEELIEQHKPDLVVVDLMMEEDDTGFRLCYFIKKNHPSMPVIMATGVAAEAGIEFNAVTDEERLWLKADVVLAKPFRCEQLEAKIKCLLKRNSPHGNADGDDCR
ncbi:MAG: response regulator [Phycisphaerae bacterium]|nr:response regulator [Phycisphaerae bacterium]